MIKTSLFFIIFSMPCFAADLQIDNINLTDFKNITKEIQANFAHSAVSSAGTNGDTFGIDTGIVAGFTKSKELESLAKEIDPRASFGVLPHGALLASVSVPMGFTGEATFFPKTEFSKIEYKAHSFALKWTFSKMWSAYFDNAIRVHRSNNDLKYSQVINNSSTGNIPVNSNISFSNSVTGISYLIGKKMGIIEPWIGAGYVEGKSKAIVSAAGGATIFGRDVSASSSQPAEITNKGFKLFAGFQVKLTLMNAGLECSRIFGVDKCTLKTSLSFGL